MTEEKINSTSEHYTKEKTTVVTSSQEMLPSSSENSKKGEQDKVSGKTVMYVLYLLYRANMVTRNNLTMLFEKIKQPVPEDVTQFLVNEEAKKS